MQNFENDTRFSIDDSDDNIRYSIRNTINMEWEKQINSVLQNKKTIKHSDTLVIEKNTPKFFVENGVSDLPLAIPLSVITKSRSGKNESHNISDGNLVNLKNGIKNAVAVINDDNRKSIVFITGLKENEKNIVVTFAKNTLFDGDDVHKAISIHTKQNITAYLNNQKNVEIYVVNKNKLTDLF